MSKWLEIVYMHAYTHKSKKGYLYNFYYLHIWKNHSHQITSFKHQAFEVVQKPIKPTCFQSLQNLKATAIKNPMGLMQQGVKKNRLDRKAREHL